MNVNCARVEVVRRTANENVSMCGGCAADTSGDCGDLEHPKDFVHSIEGTKGHVDHVFLVQE